ncbi:MAG: hypothetical protein J0M12_12940 [Deltaproteobacteria bacterium]|nr:hypothetical protein [Deltaproteobacteria bacterium]
MESVSSIGVTPAETSTSLQRFQPEPRSSLGLDFTTVLRSVAGAAGSTLTGIDPNYAALMSKQIETQQQMQLVTMESNIEKSKHETQMAAVRNIRVG